MEGGKQRISSTTSTTANLFGYLSLLISQSHPLLPFFFFPSYFGSWACRGIELIIFISVQFFHNLSNGSLISFNAHVCPPYFSRRLSPTGRPLTTRWAWPMGGISRRVLGGRREKSVFISHWQAQFLPDSPMFTTSHLTKLWLPWPLPLTLQSWEN